MRIHADAYNKAITTMAKKASVNDPSMDWEDVRQEIWLHFLEKKDTYDPSRGVKEKTYFFTLFKNKIIDLKRRANSKKRCHILWSEANERQIAKMQYFGDLFLYF